MAKEKKTRSLRIMNMHIPYHIIMILWSFIAMFPMWFLFINTFKVKKEIYTNFFGLPSKWTLANYQSLTSNSDFFAYFRNSTLVVVVSLFMILFLGSLCAYALAHWRSRTSRAIYYFFVIGMMLPIKIATIRLLQIMKALNALNTLYSLYPVYIAMGLPTAVFILARSGRPCAASGACLYPYPALPYCSLAGAAYRPPRASYCWRAPYVCPLPTPKLSAPPSGALGGILPAVVPSGCCANDAAAAPAAPWR